MPAGAVALENARLRLRRGVRSPPALAFAGLFAAALALRIYASLSYYPAALVPYAHDGAGYVRGAHVGLSAATQEPLGYPLFLRFLHALSDRLAFTIGVQHVLGLAAGTLFFLAVRRASGSAWLGLVPAALVWFNADGLFLEHAPLSESLFTFLLALALYAGVRTQERSGPLLLVLAGALAALLPTVRTVGLPVSVVILVSLAIVWWRAGLPWLRYLGLALAGALVVTGAYAVLWHHTTGRWSISVDGSGRDFYARAAMFADCSKFTPPKGTAFLCERTPPSKRPGVIYYTYIGGPGVARFGFPPHGDPLLARFARAAIVHQPLDYLDVVGIDILHYVSADVGPSRFLDYPGAGSVAFPQDVPPLDQETIAEARSYYAPFSTSGGTPANRLYRYQQVFRVPGGLLLALVVLGLVGLTAATGRARRTIAFLLAVGLTLVLAPAAIHTEWRFAVPAVGPFAAAAALAGWALARRLAASDRVRAVVRRSARALPPAPGWWSASPELGRREVALVVLAGCVLALVMHFPLPLHLSRDAPKDLGDTLAQSWQMAWDGHALLHQPLDFFQSNQFYPAANTRAYADGDLGYVLAGLVGHGPVAAITRHNVLFLFAYALAFIGGYLLARELGLGRAGAAVAGAAFAYAPYRLEHDAELNILSSGGVPLALALGLRGYRRQRPRLVFAAWLVAAWQLTLGFNLGLILLYLLGVLALVAAVSWARRRWAVPRTLVVATVAGGLVLVAANGVIARPYMEVRQHFGPRSIKEVDFYSTGPRAFFAAPRANLLWGRAAAGTRGRLDWEQEQTLFPGLAIAALALLGAFAGALPARLRLGLAVGVLATAWLSLGLSPHGSGVLWPYRALYYVAPGWDSLRVPERVWLLPMLGLAILAGDGAGVLVRRIRGQQGKALLAGGLAVVVLIEGSGFRVGHPGSLIQLGLDEPGSGSIGGPPHRPVPAMPPGQRGLPGPQMHLPLQTGEISSPRVLLWSTDGFAKVTTGIGAYQPKWYEGLKSEMVGFPDARSVARLQALRIRVVVLHPDFVPGTPWAGTAQRSVAGLPLTRRSRGGVVVYYVHRR